MPPSISPSEKKPQGSPGSSENPILLTPDMMKKPGEQTPGSREAIEREIDALLGEVKALQEKLDGQPLNVEERSELDTIRQETVDWEGVERELKIPQPETQTTQEIPSSFGADLKNFFQLRERIAVMEADRRNKKEQIRL